MRRPRLLGDILADILADMRAHDMYAVFDAEWTDVTDLLRRPSVNCTMLEIRIGDGTIVPHRNNGRTYVKKTDLETVFGTRDYSVKVTRRHD